MAVANPPQPANPQPQHPFPTYHTALDLPLQARLLCEIIDTVPIHDLEARLASTQIKPEPEMVQQVLKLSYNSPSAAVKFFRWAGLARKHSEHSWNLMVDLLGKNRLFEPMWDAVRSMKQEGVLSLTTFVSVFGSYCAAGRFGEAVMSFDVMERYGIQPDIIAVNCLLSAICREDNQTEKALEFFEKIKAKIPPDADSFAILLEGWEKEGNVAKAKTTFGEMVIRADEAIKFLQVMKGKNCLPGLKFFSNALDILVKQNDSARAILLWGIMVGSGLVPNLIMYNAMIGLLCNNNDTDNAFRLLDAMVFHGAFPDSLTYNMIFECLIKNKKVRQVGKFFNEMIKNEWNPTPENFTAAIKMLFDGDDPGMAIEIWDYMVQNSISPRDDAANVLILGFCSLGRLTEVRRFAEKMIDGKIIISESTMTKVKNACYKEGRSAREMYDNLLRKWKSSCL
ncbi:Pentatricopeptide repeat-containing protein [Forsythia ovata]|uniref:Pentatricopeptide repeat-containing protein n=1 Tax=Forsythia ovata TaxID=205694 RepID=A0ABD1W4H8_9LAMI